MYGCTAINFVKHINFFFSQVGIVCGAWWHLLELSQQSNNSFIHTALCTTTQNLDEDSFDMFYKNYCWAAIPDDPIWMTNVPYEGKVNMLSSTDNNFMIFLFDFRDLGLNLGSFFFLNSQVFKDNMEYLQHDYILTWTAYKPLILCLFCNKWSCGTYQNRWKKWNALIRQICYRESTYCQCTECGTVLTVQYLPSGKHKNYDHVLTSNSTNTKHILGE